MRPVRHLPSESTSAHSSGQDGRGHTAGSSDGYPLSFFLGLAVTLSIALVLRIQQLDIQWLTDDEWHAIHKLIASPGYFPILASFGQFDYSIPLTAFYKLLANTVGLSELRMRAPMLLSGICFVAIAVMWANRRFARLEALIFGYLVAISPMLVNYSRTARPYMISLLLSAIAIGLLAQWVRTGKDRFLVAYLPCAWLTSYLHLIMVPFVTAPWAVVFAGFVTSQRPTAAPVKVLCGAGMTAAGIAALVLPPLISDWSAMKTKAGGDLPNFDTITGVWYLWLGTDSAAAVLLGLGLAVLGLPRLKSAAPTEFAMWASGLLGILAAILWMRPAWIHNSLTLARYMLPVLPLWLLLISAGICRLISMCHSAPLRAVVGVGLIVCLMLGIPYAELLERPNNFTLHTYYQFDYRADHNPVRKQFEASDFRSPFWSLLRKQAPGSLLVAYTGNLDFASFYLPTPVTQPWHRQRMVVLQTNGACKLTKDGEAFPSQGIMLRNAVSLAEPDRLRQLGVDWVVVEHYLPQFAKDRGLARAYESQLAACRSYLSRHLGPPDYEDERIVAFHIRHRPELQP